MSLPKLIEIVPLDKPVRAEITVPGSKSITNRALILAALARGGTTLRGALWSEDTQVMAGCLRTLGFEVDVQPDASEPCNRTIRIAGKGGEVAAGGNDQRPLELFVGNAGTAARFLAAFVCLGKGVYRLHGVPRMHERPQGELFSALRRLGYQVESENHNDKLPARIQVGPLSGVKLRPGSDAGEVAGPAAPGCSVSMESSSQFASALLLCAAAAGWKVEVVGENAEESPYVRMTSELVKVFPRDGGEFQIEPDASSGSYFLAAEQFLPLEKRLEYSEQFGVSVPTTTINSLSVANWPSSRWQIDENFPRALLLCPELGHGLAIARLGKGAEDLREGEVVNLMRAAHRGCAISRKKDLGDSIMTAVVLAPFALGPVRFTDLARLRVQECERVAALRAELAKCGAKVTEEGDTLTVFPSVLHGAEIETYNDHRMAMSFAVLGLKVPGIRLRGPACVKKTFPNFFQKLAAPPPHGLGARILDGSSGRHLAADDLFAD